MAGDDRRLPRIAIGPGEVAGYFSRLTAGFHESGVTCEHFVLSPHPFSYAQHDYFLKSWNDLAVRWMERGGVFWKALGNIFRNLLRLPAFLYAVARYDTFIFCGFGSFFKFHELPLLKALGKTVVVVLVGSDARPPVFSGRHLDDGASSGLRLVHAETMAMARRVRRIERYADHIVSHTATDQFLSGTYIRWSAMGLPMVQPESVAGDGESGGAIRILHAPSRPLAKGTHVFRAIVDELREDGFDIEYVELIGVSNSLVLQALASCDFVLDELYSDIPMAMFAAEAAFFGKPAVVGSYYTDEYRVHNPDSVHPPAMFVDPDEIRAAVRRLVVDAEFRIELGRKARDFVRTHWTSWAVARRFMDVILGAAPADWKADPSSTNYIWGWGLPRNEWHRRMSDYVGEFGPSGLCFDGKERLLNSVLAHLSAR